MPRNKVFASRPPPFSGDKDFELDHSTVNGPVSFFNPTSARYRIKPSAQEGAGSSAAAQAVSGADGHVPGIEARWRARDNRKGRHALLVRHPDQQVSHAHTSTFRAILKGLKRMATECPYWDVSYLVSVFFSVGCLVFIGSGLLYWLPLVAPETEFDGETTIVGGITSFVGATLFQIGAVLLVFEACNENQTGCFGWALHQAIHGNAMDKEAAHPCDKTQAHEDPNSCKHHHQRGESSVPLRQPRPGRRWSWWPSWVELKTHYLHEIGFLASMTLVIGATIFYVSGICALPGIYENMSLAVARGVYWSTYLVGGVIFIISSLLYMLENQPNWYTPAPHLIGWHIGVWNLIGSIGWTLAASLGYCTASWCEYQGELTLIWASTAFLIGSALQWYEALDKYPVEKKERKS